MDLILAKSRSIRVDVRTTPPFRPSSVQSSLSPRSGQESAIEEETCHLSEVFSNLFSTVRFDASLVMLRENTGS